MSVIEKKLGFIGVGNMGGAIVKALLNSKVVSPENIWCSSRTPGKVKKIQEDFPIHAAATNEELVENSDIIFMGVKPQDFFSVLEPLSSLIAQEKIVVSMAAGIPMSDIKRVLQNHPRVVRIMPNTPIEVGKAVVGYCPDKQDAGTDAAMISILQPLGYVVQVSEGDQFQALTVACGSGTGFVFELLQYWQEWLEGYGFDKDIARNMAVQTFLGAANLAEKHEQQPIDLLQSRVVSKKGVTHAGLESMRELEIERALRISFEKAVLRDSELGRR